MTGITIINNPDVYGSYDTKFVDLSYLERFKDPLICKELDYSPWWYEEKLDYLRKITILPPTTTIICHFSSSPRQISCLYGMNQLKTLLDFVTGNLKVPSNLFNLWEELNNDFIVYDDFGFQDKILFSRIIRGIKLIQYNGNVEISGELFRNL